MQQAKFGAKRRFFRLPPAVVGVRNHLVSGTSIVQRNSDEDRCVPSWTDFWFGKISVRPTPCDPIGEKHVKPSRTLFTSDPK